ncbi:MAG: very short patch repair endonuclease [Verrucomicrobiota bacterium]
MPDIWTREKRSAVMSLIRGHGNKATELRLIVIFRAAGITGWRRKHKLFGKPDFVFRKARVAIFVDGCFWHGCPKCYRRPDSNKKYWDDKLNRNRQRDKDVNRLLRKKGWRVIRIWEHDLGKPLRVIARIRQFVECI